MAGVSGKKDSVSFFRVIARYLAFVMACGGRVYHSKEDYIVRRYISSQVPCQMEKSLNPGAFSVLTLAGPTVGRVQLSAFGISCPPTGSPKALLRAQGREGVKGGGELITPLCTSNSGFAHSKSGDADRTVVCMKGFSVPK